MNTGVRQGLEQAPSTGVMAGLRERFGAPALYAAGLALQKGLPFVLIPALVSGFGSNVYATFVLFYAAVQMLANIACLALPNAIITFWFRAEDKGRFLWTSLALLGISQVVIGTALWVAFLRPVMAANHGAASGPMFAVAALGFMVLYNLNAFLTSVCRARERSVHFFVAQVVAGAVLVGGVFFAQRWPSLPVLLGVFAASFILQNLWLAGVVADVLRRARPAFDGALAKSMLLFAVPLLVQLELGLFTLWVDKQIVQAAFGAELFDAFVISMQYAYAHGFVAQAMMLHALPAICARYADGNATDVRRTVMKFNLIQGSTAALWIAVILLVDRTLYPLHIHPAGFALCAAGFALWNMATSYINVLWAALKSVGVTLITLCGAAALVLVNLVAASQDTILLSYSGPLVAGMIILAGVFVMATRELRRIERTHPGVAS